MIVALLACACWLLASCGGASSGETSAPPAASSAASAPAASEASDDEPPDVGAGPGEPAPTQPPVETSAVRAAECAFPERMRVGQPATVRFSIFSAGNQPNDLPDASAALESLELPGRSGLTTWVAVALNANGQPVAQDMSRQLQQLSDRSNIWVWQVTPADSQPIVLQPIVDVEFRDAEGRVVERRTNIWTQTYTVPQVVGSSYLGVAGAWLGDSVQELLVGFIGAALLRVGSGGRQLLAQRLTRKSAPLSSPDHDETAALHTGDRDETAALSPARPDDDRDGQQ
jgi:hypothetical protein